MARTLRNITFVYTPREDRILAAINAGLREAWSVWLTRRLTLALLERTTQFLRSRSDLAQRAPAELRGEMHAFERDAAIARTKGAMSVTPTDVLQSTASWAELAERLTIKPQADNYRLELFGQSGDMAAGVVKPAELQRILQMLQAEVAKAGWLASPVKAEAAPTPAPTEPKPLRN